MERECNVGLDQWEMADNMDLGYVLQDFEEYFELKFQKKPVLVRKNPNANDGLGTGRRKPPAGGVLPKIQKSSEIGSASASGRKGPGATPLTRQSTGQALSQSRASASQAHSTP